MNIILHKQHPPNSQYYIALHTYTHNYNTTDTPVLYTTKVTSPIAATLPPGDTHQHTNTLLLLTSLSVYHHAPQSPDTGQGAYTLPLTRSPFSGLGIPARQPGLTKSGSSINPHILCHTLITTPISLLHSIPPLSRPAPTPLYTTQSPPTTSQTTHQSITHHTP